MWQAGRHDPNEAGTIRRGYRDTRLLSGVIHIENRICTILVVMDGRGRVRLPYFPVSEIVARVLLPRVGEMGFVSENKAMNRDLGGVYSLVW